MCRRGEETAIRVSVYERIALEGKLRDDHLYGSGGFQGFWTPCE
jgi:hypothetical protein